MNAMLRVVILLAGLFAAFGALGGAPGAAAQGAATLVQTLEKGAAPPAAKPPVPAATPSASPPAPSAAPPISPAQARDILETLNDPKKRAAFAATLEAMTKALPPAALTSPPGSTPGSPPGGSPASPPAADQAAANQPADTAPAPPAAELKLPLKPDSLGARLLVSASDVIAEASNHAEEAVSAMNSLPALWTWVKVMTTDPWGRQMLTDTGWRLLVVFGVGLLAQYAVELIIRRPRAGLEAIGARHAAGDIEPVPNTPDGSRVAGVAVAAGTAPMPAHGALVEHLLGATQ